MPRLSAVHHAWRWLPRGPRRAAAQHVAAALAPRPDAVPPPAAPGIAVAGELDRDSGLGEAARLVLEAARSLGLPTWKVRPGGDVPPAGVPLLLVGNAPGVALQALRLGRGVMRGRRVIGYWPWELPTLPRSWRAGRAFVHDVWAPSRFAAEAFRPLWPDVRTVPFPLAVRSVGAPAAGRSAFGLAPDALVTLVVFSLASSFERKNPLAAIEAHGAAFGDRADRVLFLHVTNPQHFPDDFARLRAAANRPNVRLHTADLDRGGVDSLFAAADIVLSLHRSEGFGLVPAEAMRLGRAVVATDWSATTEFMDADCAALVPARLVPACDPRGVFEAPGAVWADPDVAEAAGWLRRLADDPALRARFGAAARVKVATCLGPEPLNAALRALRAT